MPRNSLFRQQHALLSTDPEAYQAVVDGFGFWQAMRALYHGELRRNPHGVLVLADEYSTHVWVDGSWVDWDLMPAKSLAWSVDNVTPATKPLVGREG